VLEVGGFAVLDCRECGFKHLEPRPSTEELRRIYRHEYYQQDKPLYLERHRQDLDWWNLVHRERYEALEAHVPPGRRRILDVGCGPGSFLALGAERGWEAVGLEPSTAAAAHARGLGLTIVEEHLDADTAGGLGTFDAVHLSNVLEHVHDPRATLDLVRGLLAPGGVVLVVVPNDFNPFQRAAHEARGLPPWWVAPPHHVNYFDHGSLRRLVERAGLIVLEAGASFPIDLFLLMGDHYVGDEDLGRACHERRMTLEKTLHAAGLGELKRRLYRELAGLGLGREAVVLARGDS
jgi:SAM-dependent methyltransferase